MYEFTDTPWQDFGHEIKGAPTIREGLAEVGLDWRVELHRLETTTGLHCPDHNAVVRSDNSRVLGVVGQKYEPLQNQDAWDWFEPILETGTCVMEAAGSFKGGADVWVMAKVRDALREVIPGDTVEPYVLLSNNHVGKRGVTMGFFGSRIACSNQFPAIIRAAMAKARHTRNMLERMRKPAEEIAAQLESWAAQVAQFRTLAQAPINSTQLDSYVARVFRVTVPGADSDARMPQVIERVQELHETGRGTEIPGVRGTWWGAYNAVTEYLTHERGRTSESRLASNWFGQSAKDSARALTLAVDACAS